MDGSRSWVLGILALLLTASTLGLAACSSGSGDSPKASGTGNKVTGAESVRPASKGSLAGDLSGQVQNAP
jgi:hypothetical protein